MMITFSIPNGFSPAASLECGQTFRFQKTEDGYLVFSADKACLLQEEQGRVFVFCDEENEGYFKNYFDLQTDYAPIIAEAKGFAAPLSDAAEYGKGIRIFRQDKAECLLSFIVSQQNNIPRIKGILARLCESLGEERQFRGICYRAFPTLEALSKQDENFYRSLGLGYRAKYLEATSKQLYREGLSALENKSGKELKTALVKYMGIGNKIADCVALFAFHDLASFPVDTWVEKIYHENYGGRETNRDKINAYFADKFGAHAGIFQQYLFYYKRENP